MSDNSNAQVQPGLWDEDESAVPASFPTSSKRTRAVAPQHLASATVTELWTIEQVADFLGVPKQTIYCWRTTGYGPAGFRVGKHLRWRASTVVAWTIELERQQ